MSLHALQQQVARALTGQADGQADSGNDPGLILASEVLVAKRRVEAASWLPRTSRTLGTDFTRRFAEHARSYRPRGWNHPRDDAIAFASLVVADRSLTQMIRNLAAYEHAQTRAAAPGPLFIAHHWQHDPARTDAGPGTHLWWRWGRRARLCHLQLPWG